MAFPIIVFNNSTGSDTNSGAGPGDGTTSGSAITGSDASTDAGGYDITVPNADLSNVLTDGSHAIWLNAGSGKQFGKIVGKGDSGTASAYVTVSQQFTTFLSGRTYAIGGKRSDPWGTTSRYLYQNQNGSSDGDAEGGWSADIEYTGTDYWATSVIEVEAFGNYASLPFKFFSSSETRPTIGPNIASFSYFMYTQEDDVHIVFENLQIEGNAAGADLQGYFVPYQDCSFEFYGCKIVSPYTGYSSLIKCRNSNNNFCQMVDCEITGFDGRGIFEFTPGTQYGSTLKMLNCFVYDCSEIIGDTYVYTWNLEIIKTVFKNCGSIRKAFEDGSFYRSSISVTKCIFIDSDDYAIEIENEFSSGKVLISENIFVEVGSYAISVEGDNFGAFIDRNAFYNSTTGNYENREAGADDIELTADPFEDSANDDFTLNDTAGAGAALAAASYTLPSTSTTIYPFNHLKSPSGGGGSTVIVVEDD